MKTQACHEIRSADATPGDFEGLRPLLEKIISPPPAAAHVSLMPEQAGT
jgi:hypothetical protein